MSIGGYFGLELNRGQAFHSGALALSSARSCLEVILKARKIKILYIPYYTCEVVLEPITRLGIEIRYYNIDYNFEIVNLPVLENGAALLYTNYFALKEDYISRLYESYGSLLIVDNAQAFFSQRVEGVDTFYSPRKYFGVADGGYLYADGVDISCYESDRSYDRMSHLLKRCDVSSEFGFNDFQDNDSKLCNRQVYQMSNITNGILCSLDYDRVKGVRTANFDYLHSNLKCYNELKLPDEYKFIPFVYPIMFRNACSLRDFLIGNRIYVARYWPNVLSWCGPDTVEYDFAENLVPLPIDQRYGLHEMQQIVMTINKYFENNAKSISIRR